MASEDDVEGGEPEDGAEFGLSLDLDECLDEFCEPAKVLPFVRPEKKG